MVDLRVFRARTLSSAAPLARRYATNVVVHGGEYGRGGQDGAVEHSDRGCGVGRATQQLLSPKVVVCLGLLECRLSVLTDHHERRKENRLERHDEGQHGPRAFLQEQHPDGEYRCMNPDEVHRPRERGDSIRQTQLEIPASSLRLFHHDWMVVCLAAQELAGDQLWDAPGSSGAVIGRHDRSFRGLSQPPALRELYPRIVEQTVSASTPSTPRNGPAQQHVQSCPRIPAGKRNSVGAHRRALHHRCRTPTPMSHGGSIESQCVTSGIDPTNICGKRRGHSGRNALRECMVDNESRKRSSGRLLHGCRTQQRLLTDVVGTHNDGETSARHHSGVAQSHRRSPNGRY
jgi:hypothetical protein